jgi:hypothetical protein
MNYDFTLKTVGLIVGIWLIASHAGALAQGAGAMRWLTGFPRSYRAGVVLLTIDWLWTELLALRMDWGEFYYLQKWIVILLPVCFFLTLRFVDDYLAVRALGILLLLAAAPLLDAAFLQPPESRLLVVVLAYVWIVFGMLWVGQPHLMRDQIGWMQKSAMRWRVAMASGLVYGLVLLVCALAWY